MGAAELPRRQDRLILASPQLLWVINFEFCAFLLKNPLGLGFNRDTKTGVGVRFEVRLCHGLGFGS